MSLILKESNVNFCHYRMVHSFKIVMKSLHYGSLILKEQINCNLKLWTSKSASG